MKAIGTIFALFRKIGISPDINHIILRMPLSFAILFFLSVYMDTVFCQQKTQGISTISVESRLLQQEEITKRMMNHKDPSLAYNASISQIRRINERILLSFQHPTNITKILDPALPFKKSTVYLLPFLYALRANPPSTGLPYPHQPWHELDLLIVRLEKFAKELEFEDNLPEIDALEELFFKEGKWIRKSILAGPLKNPEKTFFSGKTIQNDEKLLILRGTPLDGLSLKIASALGKRPALLLLDSKRPLSAFDEKILKASNLELGLEIPWNNNSILSQEGMKTLIGDTLANFLRNNKIPIIFMGPLLNNRPAATAIEEKNLVPLVDIPQISHHPSLDYQKIIESIKDDNIWILDVDNPFTLLLIKDFIGKFEASAFIKPSKKIIKDPAFPPKVH